MGKQAIAAFVALILFCGIFAFSRGSVRTAVGAEECSGSAQAVSGINNERSALGKFRITVYDPSSDNAAWGYRTATGVTSRHLQTVAVDPKVIPLGSKLYIDGLGVVTAVDTGSAVKGRVIDVFYDGSGSQSLDWISSFGTSKEVYILN